jgi:hypothetical protein
VNAIFNGDTGDLKSPEGLRPIPGDLLAFGGFLSEADETKNVQGGNIISCP